MNGEDHIPMERIVRAAVKDQRLVEVLSFGEGLELENAGAPRRYRQRPPNADTK